jgi:molecular chaperone DnaK (HSP70)
VSECSGAADCIWKERTRRTDELETALEDRRSGRHDVLAARSRFSIGIDLGTTNCALAFAPLDIDAESEILLVPQLEPRGVTADASMLPSFLYLPEEGAVTQLDGRTAGQARWVVGRFARTMAAHRPGRVVHSAKSWLCHHAADRSEPFLPWRSSDIAGETKISPVRACALILRCLRDAWNERFAGAGAEFAFDAQLITVAVPASFDGLAQRLTLAAAAEAGFPNTVRLLEEPQAAFHYWLERRDFDGSRAEDSRNGAARSHVLVVDVGGGTSDFALMKVCSSAGNCAPRLERIAVSDHILLGGDNMDLAIARRLEPQLVDEAEGLSDGQWSHLVARCREVKERALSDDGPREEVFAVSIPGHEPEMRTGLRCGHLTRAEVEALLLDAFFPECDADDGPAMARAALGEWGLPYSPEPAVTRHLADFLKNGPAVGAVFFNGGSLRPRAFRQRICRLIGKWQQCSPPVELENAEPDLAVARGAAYFGAISQLGAERTDAATLRGIRAASRAASATSAEIERSIYQRVQERAYRLWEVEGRPDGRQLDHWSQAELEVSAVSTRGVA